MKKISKEIKSLKKDFKALQENLDVIEKEYKKSKHPYFKNLSECEALMQDKVYYENKWASSMSDKDLQKAVVKVTTTYQTGQVLLVENCVKGKKKVRELHEQLTALEVLQSELIYEALVRGAVVKKQKDEVHSETIS